jgi:uroporphyrinogen-III synthase
MRLLVTRPRPGGEASAARLRALGHEVIEAPLLATEAVAWEAPAALPDALLLTSAAAARLADAPAALRALPCHVVGAATAAAARDAGFGDVRVGPGSVQPLLDTLTGRVLHLAGEDRTPVVLPPGLTLATAIVYRARLLPLAALPAVDLVLLYSARTARHFAAEHDRLGGNRGATALLAISPGVAAAAGPGWRDVTIAATPDDNAMLAAIATACQ